jgi:hypothetical protein
MFTNASYACAGRGVYVLTESIRRGGNRLPLQRLDEASGDYSGGYILEMSFIRVEQYDDSVRGKGEAGKDQAIVELGPSRIDFVYPKVTWATAQSCCCRPCTRHHARAF